mgnify:CR=1 FL=1
MNALKNKVQLIGNLGQDPEIVTLENGNKLAKFSIATSDTYKNAMGEKVEDTQWHQIVAWGKTADIVENFVGGGYINTTSAITGLQFSMSSGNIDAGTFKLIGHRT